MQQNKTIIRVPLETYSYIEFEFLGTPEEAIKEFKRVNNLYKNPPVESNLPPTQGLKYIDLQRLLWKRLCNQGLEMEEVESLGTAKIFSQRDVHKLIESLVAKSKRETGGDRSESKQLQREKTINI